jgi:hypothetical protein
MTIEDINHRLDTRPYFDLGLKYDSNISLPDSIKSKMIKALNRELPQHFDDSIFTLPEVILKNIEEYAWQKCKNDTVCFEKIYAERYAMNVKKKRDYYYNQCYSLSLILACGNWNIIEAIPYLEGELQNQRCKNRERQVKIEMALAKLNDSIKQVLLNKYTLSYVLKTTSLDTINDKTLLTYEILEKTWTLQEGIETAMYLKSKEMLLNILDLVYIRGMSQFCVGSDCAYFPKVFFVVDEFNDYNYFHNDPNYKILNKICEDYRSPFWSLCNKKRNKKEQQELDKLLSTANRTKIRDQIREWIIANVNFE